MSQSCCTVNYYDVTIASGSPSGDHVLLDTSPTINSFTLGTGSFTSYSEFFDSSDSPEQFTVNGALTINQNGFLTLYSSTLSTGTLTNYGRFDLYSTASANTFTNRGTALIETGALVKRGKELHEPDRMYLNPNSVVFVETVGRDSKVARLIAENGN